MSKRPNILLIVGGINEMAAQYDKAFLDELQNALGIQERVVCETEPCLRRMFSEADALIYLDGFPLSYKEIVAIADSVWNAPPVIGIDKSGDKIRIWSEAYETEWIPSSELSTHIKNAAKRAIDYRNRGKGWTTFIYAIIFILALMAVRPAVHIYKKTLQNHDVPAVEEILDDDSPSDSP